MNCIEHEDISAVSACANCGVGLCKECEANSVFRIDNQALCKKCNTGLALENDRLFKNVLRLKQIAIGACIAGIGLGLIIFVMSKITGAEFGFLGMFICMGIGGSIGTYFAKDSKEKPANKPKEKLLNRIASLIGAFIGAAIVCPILIIMGLIGIGKVKKQIVENDVILNQLGAGSNQ